MTYIRNDIADIYDGRETTLADGNLVATSPVLKYKGLKCAVHEWRIIPEDITALDGVLQNVTASIYFDLKTPEGLEVAKLIADRDLIRINNDVLWLVRGDPERHGRFQQTSYCACIVEKQTFDISGIQVNE